MFVPLRNFLYFARHSFVHDYHRHCEIPHYAANDKTYLEAQNDSSIPVISPCLIFIIGTTNDGTYLEAQKDSSIPVISKRLIFIIGTANDAIIQRPGFQ
ncbi:hypothetical protein FACS1894181_12490 [Bacteroidia bacterium]|nr:hypothetical protein FACS1894181_12490 [Bacteroidia bacterium]